jgi:hypothetical protein
VTFAANGRAAGLTDHRAAVASGRGVADDAELMHLRLKRSDKPNWEWRSAKLLCKIE